MNDKELESLRRTIMTHIGPALGDLTIETEDAKLRNLAYIAFIDLARLSGYVLERANPQYFECARQDAPQVPRSAPASADDPSVVPFPTPATSTATASPDAPTH